MKRLAVYIAAEEVVAAYRDSREHPSLQADQRLEGCVNLLSLRLEVFERRERTLAEQRETQVIALHALPTAEKGAVATGGFLR